MIPLRDLSRPPDSVIAEHPGGRLGRSRSISGDEGYARGGRSILSRRSIVRRYERIAEDSPSREGLDSQDGFQTINLSQEFPQSALSPPRTSTPDGTPNAGIRFVQSEQNPQTHSRLGSIGTMDGPDHGMPDSLASLSHMEAEYFNDTSSPVEPAETDRTPLTDRRYLQPISGASEPQTGRNKSFSGQSGQSVRFAEDGSENRLGDDLPHLESGLNRRHHSYDGPNIRSSVRSKRLSPTGSSSALSRAGSMMKMMSQRVVNLSNEPELVEQSLRRKSSLKTARLEGPPSLPAMFDYAHDIRSSPSKESHDAPEKRLFSNRKKQGPQVNPLKGNSLGIFSPENKLRKALCEILIHPATEPIILILIIIQTVLLAVESSVQKRAMVGRWGASVFDYAFLALFIVYTLELIARTIVSGLILNPEEYSTLDRSQGLSKAILAKGRELFIPQRQFSTRKSANPVDPQISILRSFTGMQPQANHADEAAQQRARLARRAFLRHSFNRLDFLAVVAYWVSFILSIFSIESSQRLFVFRMLSSLRILRLLALTSGTTVSLSYVHICLTLLISFRLSFEVLKKRLLCWSMWLSSLDSFGCCLRLSVSRVSSLASNELVYGWILKTYETSR